MRPSLATALAFVLCALPSLASAQVYKCKTAQGTVFSQTPCAANAEEIKVKGVKQSAGARSNSDLTSPVTAAPDGAADVDFEDKPFPGTTDELVVLVGKPQGIYYEADDEYWLYLLGCRKKDRNCPEFRVIKNKVMQINWIPESEMRKSVIVAEGFSSFRPNRAPQDKSFTYETANVQGTTRAGVVEKLGPPDYKRAYRGIEVWEYHKVRASEGRELTLFLEFEGDKVAKVIGN